MTNRKTFPTHAIGAGVLLLGLVSTAQAGLLGGSKPKAVALQDGVDIAQAYQFAVEAPKFTKYFKPSRKVAITSFRVQIATGAQESSTRRQFLGGGAMSSSTLAVTLGGVSEEQVQAIADRLYDDYVQMLTNSGYTVVPADELAANPEFRKLVGDGAETRSKGGVLSANSRIVGVAHKASFSPGAVQMGSIRTENKISETLGAMVLHVNLGVNFASLKEMNWFDVKTAPCQVGDDGTCAQLGSGVKGEVRQSMSPAGEGDAGQLSGNIDVITQWTFDQYKLKAPVVFASEVVEEVGANSSQSGGLLSRMTSATASHNLVATADYSDKVTRDLHLALEMFNQGLPKP